MMSFAIPTGLRSASRTQKRKHSASSRSASRSVANRAQLLGERRERLAMLVAQQSAADLRVRLRRDERGQSVGQNLERLAQRDQARRDRALDFDLAHKLAAQLGLLELGDRSLGSLAAPARVIERSGRRGSRWSRLIRRQRRLLVDVRARSRSRVAPVQQRRDVRIDLSVDHRDPAALDGLVPGLLRDAERRRPGGNGQLSHVSQAAGQPAEKTGTSERSRFALPVTEPLREDPLTT